MLYEKPFCYDNWEIKIYVPADAVSVFEFALEPYAVALLSRLIEEGSQKDFWEVQAIFEHQPDAHDISAAIQFASKQAKIQLPEYQIVQMPKKDWLRESLVSFPPVTIGQYYIYGSHIKEAPPTGKISLEIDAATAFGSGEHQTTQGCLEALNDLENPVHSALDMGCGSGILAMAYAKTFGRLIDAVDNDPESVLVTMQNAHKNKLDKLISVWQSEGYTDVSKKYDLVFANILARPLMDMAQDLHDHLNPNGVAILSGFLYRQEKWVLKAHTDAGLKFVKKYRIKGWSTLVVERN